MMTIPEAKIEVIDQMDRGIDLLKTVWLATTSSDCDADHLDQIASSLYHVIEILKPVRSAVNKAHGEGRI